ncbi:MAG: condensation domain-containing protein, partial [Acidobacteriota bacterium]
AQAQLSLDLFQGPLIKALFFNLGTGQQGRLLIVAHHLVIDAVSFRIIIEDIQTNYSQLNRGEEVALPEKTASFQQWARALADFACSPQLLSEIPYWLSQSQDRDGDLPVDFPNGINNEKSACMVMVSLDETDTQTLLQVVPTIYRTQINDILLTALTLAISQWRGIQPILIDLEGHGREEVIAGIDLSRTVGWFTTIYPVRLNIGKVCNFTDTINTIKLQLRQLPNKGIGYGVLRYLKHDLDTIEKLQFLPRAQLIFNYLGQFDQSLYTTDLFRLANEPYGALYCPEAIRSHVLQVVGSVWNGCLQINWIYSTNIHRRDTIEMLAQYFLDSLRNILFSCRTQEKVRYTTFDFPEAELSQKELDGLFNE